MDLLEGKSLEAEIDSLRVPTFSFTIIGKKLNSGQRICKTNHALIAARSVIYA